MPYPNPAIRKYQQVEAASASPQQLVLMLYDGALRFINKARGAMERGDVAGKGEAIGRALAIVGELQGSLNPAVDPDLVHRLTALYRFVHDSLIEANISGRPDDLDPAVQVLTTLRDGWREAAKNLGRGNGR